MSLPALLDRVLQDPLRLARSGQRAIGYLGWDVPIELICAAGAAPVHLGTLAVENSELANRFLESSFSVQSRAVAQHWLAGALDSLEAVIFSRSDDSAQRLYYYLCELQRMGECQGPKPLLYDLARIRRSSSVAHTIESTRLLAAALGVDEQRLPEAIDRWSARASLLGALAELRESGAPPPGGLAHRIIRAACTDWSIEFDASLREWLAQPATTRPRNRVLLVGSVPTDESLHDVIEVDGVVVVQEINESYSATDPLSVAAELPESAGAIEIIARRCYQQKASAASLLQSPAEIVRAARAQRADGVIVWMLATDTGLAWEAPRIERALSDARIPTLMLTSQPQISSADALAQIQEFRRGLGTT
jgi:benzoyl-CoA reductase/2-hydroxyglutaryl-CoA dehydratase subunit BcrC/BadD/HgdB